MRISCSLLLLFLSLVIPCSACKAKPDSVSNPDATTGVMSESLDRRQQSRLALLGRTAAPTRYTEKIDGNRIRVVAIDFGGTALGECSDLAGSLLPGNCMPNNARKPSFSPGSKDAPLNSGMFRQYSTQVGTTVEAKVAIGPTATEDTYYVSRNFLVLEWRRYNLQRLEGYPSLSEVKNYFVSALEQGIAIRIVFDVTLRTADAKFSATFGIADLSVALARNEATVEVSYEVLGTDLDLIPGSAITVTSLKEYLDILAEFYRVVGVVSTATQLWAKGGGVNIADGTSVGTVDINRGTEKTARSVEIKRTTFEPAILAYYVSGTGVGENFADLRNVEACEDILAHHQFLDHDLQWHKSMIDHHHSVWKYRLTASGKRSLARAIEETRDIHAKQRELMSDASSLACVRTCVSNSHRLRQVCTAVAEGATRESIDCKGYERKSVAEIEEECAKAYQWVYDKTLPLDLKRRRRVKQPKETPPKAVTEEATSPKAG